MKTVKKLWVGIGLLVLLVPLGLIIPALFHTGGGWGEWSVEQIEKMIGYVPEGMRNAQRPWQSPMPDYLASGRHGLLRGSLGYVLAALIGVAAAAALAYLLTKIIGRRNKQG